MRHHHLILASCLGLILVPGCTTGPEAEDENVIAPAGKEDNFFSNVAQEYLASATVEIVLEDSYKDKAASERDARARTIMAGKTKAIAWYLHLYLIDKSRDDKQASYGGMRAMVLDGSYDSDALKADAENPLRYSYQFSVQVGGSKELLKKIRADKKLGATDDVFPLQMEKLSNSAAASFTSGPHSGEWSPESCNCELETVQVKLAPIPASNDSYLDYEKYLADGVIDISIHVGWDYHARYDITHSRTLYNWLVDEMGFTSPAAKYEEYNRLSGPLTKKLTVNGREILAKVTIFRPDPCESWDEDGSWGAWAQAVEADKEAKKRSCPDWPWADPAANANPTTDAGASNLMRDLKDSMRTRDAILFTGHSGYTYGYALASWYKTSRGDLDPPEIRTMDLPKDRSQLFVFSGCDTYHVADAFRDNPNKKGLVNADIITTTSFSNSGDVSDTQDLVKALVGDGALKAWSFGKLMSSLNPSSSDYSKFSFFTMYGVHGLDDNPLANPLGDATKSCGACSTDSDCAAAGNVCVRLNDSEKVCAVECLHDKGCAADQVCRQFGSASSGYLRGMACVPKTLSCGVTPPPPPAAKEYAAQGDLKKNETKSYVVEVGEGAKNIVVTMTGTGDADLYTKLGSAPTLSKYTCRPYKNGSNETCKHSKATAGTLQILVNGYSAKSHFELKVTWQ
jgi:hypothetical protein